MDKIDKHWVNPTPMTCGICKTTKLPLVHTGVPAVLWCGNCDGWPPKLEPPDLPATAARPHVQGCSHANGPSDKRCICPWNR